MLTPHLLRQLALWALLLGTIPSSSGSVVWIGEIEATPRLEFPARVTFDWFEIHVAEDGDYPFILSQVEGEVIIPSDLRFEILTRGERYLELEYRSPQMGRWEPMHGLIGISEGDYLIRLTTERGNWDGWDGIVPTWGSSQRSQGQYGFQLLGEAVTVSTVMEGNLDGTFTTTLIPEPGVFPLVAFAVGVLFAGRHRSNTSRTRRG